MLNTALNDRVLWYDGSSAFDPSNLLTLVHKYDVHYVTELNADVKAFNKHVNKDQEITHKTTCDELVTTWNIPDEYKQLNVIEYVTYKHEILTKGLSDDECDSRDKRLAHELVKYDQFNLFDVIRAVIWIINNLTDNDVVWGVGRGSSVSSYVLYVIGVHDVDSHAYDLDIDDFLHDQEAT